MEAKEYKKGVEAVGCQCAPVQATSCQVFSSETDEAKKEGSVEMNLDGKEMVIDERTVVVKPEPTSRSHYELIVDKESGHVDAIWCCDEMFDAIKTLLEKRKP